MAAAYQFQDVFIQIFDINTVPEFLRSTTPAAVKNLPFGFLANKSDYEKKQSSDELIKTPNFVVQRFPKNKLKESELWERYIDAIPPAKIPYWDRQVPFYVRLRRQQLSLHPDLKLDPAACAIDSYAMLNALGWSTHVELRLRLNCTTQALADIVSKLRSKNAPAYILNGTPLTLKDLLKYYRDQILADGFPPGMHSDQPENYWHFISVDIVKAAGPNTKLTRLKNIDLNGFLNIVFPNHLPIKYDANGDELLPKVQNMLFTDIDGEYHNFSVTDFNAGSFTFLQADAIGSGKEAPLMCYARNASECMWVCYAWFHYCWLFKNTKTTPKIAHLLDSGNAALLNLYRTFNNRTCQGMFRNHKDMPALP